MFADNAKRITDDTDVARHRGLRHDIAF